MRRNKHLEQDLANLIEGCLVNDRRAQQQLYRQLYGFAMSIAMRYSRDESDAGDILSHAFLKLFKSIQSFDPVKGSLHAWLKKIITNEALDHIRQRGRFASVELETVEEPAIDSKAVGNMDMEEVMDFIRQLPPATHAVFTLYVMEGFNHKEIATLLNIREGTSKWHLSEARKTLQQKLSAPDTT